MQMFNDKELVVILQAAKVYQDNYVLDDDVEVLLAGIIGKIEGTFRLLDHIFKENDA